MSLLKYFSHKAKNKGSCSSLPSSLSVSLPTRVPSLSSWEIEVTNEFVDKAVTATTVSTASSGKYVLSIDIPCRKGKVTQLKMAVVPRNTRPHGTFKLP